MKNWYFRLLLCAMLAFSLVACGSAPEEEQPAETTPVVEASTTSTDDAAAAKAAADKAAADKAAKEKAEKEAENARIAEQARLAKEAEDARIAAEKALADEEARIAAEKALAAAQAVADVFAARQSALDAGIYDYYPDEFDYVDEMAFEALYADLSDDEKVATATEFVNLYNAFENVARAEKAYEVLVYYEAEPVGIRVEELMSLTMEEPLDSALLKEKSAEIADAYEAAIDVLSSRNDALLADIEDYFPEEFALVDEIAVETYMGWEDGASTAVFLSEAENLDNVYGAFENVALASKTYEKIIEFDVEPIGVRADGIVEMADTFDGVALKAASAEILAGYNASLAVLESRNGALELGSYENYAEIIDYLDELSVDTYVDWEYGSSTPLFVADAANLADVYALFDVVAEIDETVEAVAEYGVEPIGEQVASLAALVMSGTPDAQELAEKADEILDAYSIALTVLEAREHAVEVGAEENYPAVLYHVDDVAVDAYVDWEYDGSLSVFAAEAENLIGVYGVFDVVAEIDGVVAELAEYEVEPIGNRTEELAALAMVDRPVAAELKAAAEDVLEGYKAALPVLEARDEALALGAYEYFPEVFDHIDEVAVDVYVDWEYGMAQDEYLAEAENLENVYGVFELAMEIPAVMDELAEYGVEPIGIRVEGLVEVAMSDDPDAEEIADKVKEIVEGYRTALPVLEARDEALALGAYENYPEVFDHIDEVAVDVYVDWEYGGSQDEYLAEAENLVGVYGIFEVVSEIEDVIAELAEYEVEPIGNRTEELAALAMVDRPVAAELKAAAEDVLEGYKAALPVLEARDEALALGAYENYPEVFDHIDEVAVDVYVDWEYGMAQDEYLAEAENLVGVYGIFEVVSEIEDVIAELAEYEVEPVGYQEAALYAEAMKDKLDGATLNDGAQEILEVYTKALEVLECRQVVVDAYYEYYDDVIDNLDEQAIDVYLTWEDDGDEPKFMDGADNLILVYSTTEILEEASGLYEEIVEKNLQDKDMITFLAAAKAEEELYEMAMGDYVGGKEMQVKANEIVGLYTKVIERSYKTTAEDVRVEYLAAKKLADSIKAKVADKQGYKAAVDALNNADAIYARQQWKKSYEAYVVANDMMQAVYENVSQKRAAAEEAMRKALAKEESVAEIAARADVVAPLADDADLEEAAE